MAKKGDILPETPRKTLEMVCAGDRLTMDETLFQVWYEVDEDEMGAAHAFDPLPRVGVGGVYKVQVTLNDEGGVKGVVISGEGAPSYARRWDDAKQVTEWRAQHDAAHITKATQRKAINELAREEAFKALEPFARALAAGDNVSRGAVLAVMIDYVTRRASEIRMDRAVRRELSGRKGK